MGRKKTKQVAEVLPAIEQLPEETVAPDQVAERSLGNWKQFLVSLRGHRPMTFGAATGEEAWELYRATNGIIATDWNPEIVEVTDDRPGTASDDQDEHARDPG